MRAAENQPGVLAPAVRLTPKRLAAGVPAVAVEAGGGVVHPGPDGAELVQDVRVVGAVLKLGGVLGIEDLGHVEPVQPDLVGVDGLVPEVPLGGAGLALDLAVEQFDGLAVLLLPRGGVDVEQGAALAQVVQVVVLLVKAPHGAIVQDVVIQILFGEIEVDIAPGYLVEVQQGDHHAPVDVVPAVDLPLVDLLDVPQGLVGGGALQDLLDIAFDHIHSSMTSSTLAATIRSPS